jgi:acetyl esterase/lipase
MELDIARPAKPGPHPVVILLHGGAWIAGTKLMMRDDIKLLAERGYVAVAPSYRLVRGNGSRFPAALQDVRCALRWLRANAKTYDLDPERAVMLGMSAGGHLAALVTTATDDGITPPSCHPDVEPVTIRGVVTLSAPLDLRPAGKQANRAQEEIITAFLGVSPYVDPGRAAQASPAAYVRAGLPPFLMVHGQSDHTVPPQQARDMLALLKAAAVPVTLIQIDGVGHRIVPLSTRARTRVVSCTTLRFLDERLRRE